MKEILINASVFTGILTLALWVLNTIKDRKLSKTDISKRMEEKNQLALKNVIDEDEFEAGRVKRYRQEVEGLTRKLEEQNARIKDLEKLVEDQGSQIQELMSKVTMYRTINPDDRVLKGGA